MSDLNDYIKDNTNTLNLNFTKSNSQNSNNINSTNANFFNNNIVNTTEYEKIENKLNTKQFSKDNKVQKDSFSLVKGGKDEKIDRENEVDFALSNRNKNIVSFSNNKSNNINIESNQFSIQHSERSVYPKPKNDKDDFWDDISESKGYNNNLNSNRKPSGVSSKIEKNSESSLNQNSNFSKRFLNTGKDKAKDVREGYDSSLISEILKKEKKALEEISENTVDREKEKFTYKENKNKDNIFSNKENDKNQKVKTSLQGQGQLEKTNKGQSSLNRGGVVGQGSQEQVKNQQFKKQESEFATCKF